MRSKYSQFSPLDRSPIKRAVGLGMLYVTSPC